MKWASLCFGLCLQVCAGCAGTETGNPSFDGTMGYDAYSSAPARVGLRVAPAEPESVQVISAWLVLGNVSFLAGDECTKGRGEIGRAAGLGAGDHVGSQAPPSHVELPTSELCGVRLPIASVTSLPSAAPTELEDHSLLITGKRGPRVFHIASPLDADLLLEADGDAIDLDDVKSGMLIGFDMATWLADIDWDAVDAEADGTLRIDEGHNAAQLRAFESRIAAGVALFPDRDSDGMLDDGSMPIAHVRE